MTPYLRQNAYYVDIRPPGYPHRITRSTGQRNKKTAAQMEATIRSLAQHGRFDALDALRARKITLGDLHAAYMARDVDAVLTQRKDPPLAVTVSRFLEAHRDPRYRLMSDRLLQVAGTGARTSWLTDPSNLRDVIHLYRSQGLAAATERREMVGVSLMLGDTFGEIERRRIMAEVKLRPARNQKVDPYSPAELEALRAHAGEWWITIALALATGIRRSEQLKLRRMDVDLSIPAVRVPGGKTPAARRTIPIAGEAVSLIRVWLHQEKNEREHEPLFPDVTDSRHRVAFTQILEVSKVRKRIMPWHALRHTYGAECARAGMPLPELKVLMGHESIETTMIYAEYAPSMRSINYEQALQRMGIGRQDTQRSERRAG